MVGQKFRMVKNITIMNFIQILIQKKIFKINLCFHTFGGYFPNYQNCDNFSNKWKDNFLVASLNGNHLYRMKFNKNFEKVFFIEGIFIGKE